jgi:hypothetical protein
MHVEDDALRQHINQHPTEFGCCYCDVEGSTPVAATLAAFTFAFMTGVGVYHQPQTPTSALRLGLAVMDGMR